MIMSTPKGTQKYAIKEAAKLSGLPESTLRYYETIGLIDSIGRDPSSKHRVYREDDINKVISIACLNATGMSIEDMRTYLINRTSGARSAKDQIKLLDAQRIHLAEEERFLKLRRQYVETKIAYWQSVATGNKKGIESAKLKAKTIAKNLKLPKEL